ncbi:histidine phosphatase family protein, partial [Lactobacillus parabuchneri]|nr:histidine phosphatase family protein [Lentilactobacillus parabuchneri]
MTISLYFVRHGQTYLNKYHRIQGVIDSPLTDKGIADAVSA